MPDRDTPIPHVPESRAVLKKHTRLSVVWIIPILAALVGAWVAVTRIMAEGPKITIVFSTAEGLEAGKTKVQYNGVEVGTITTVRLSDDHKNVVTTAQMAPKTEDFLLDDTELWVVRPRISGANVSGLGTLISGAYIGMEIGHSQKSRRDFVALNEPPVVTGDVTGRFFRLKTANLGSLDTGTPIYFRRLQVGQVASYELDKDGRALSIKVFVRSPYDQFINLETRFWHASGIDVSLSASGFTVQTQSMLSILVGGIAFESPASDPVLAPAAADTVFTLFSDRAEAFKLPARNPQTYLLIFKESTRGLAVGAPVEFKGIPIGEVAGMRAQFDAKTFEFSVPVTIHVDPAALGVKILEAGSDYDSEAVHRKVIDTLVSKGVRAQLKSGNLLTGALYVSLDVFPDAPPVTLDWSHEPVEFPTVPGQFQEMQESVANIIKKLNQVPFKGIGDDLQKAIGELDQTLVTARGTLEAAHGTMDAARGTMVSGTGALDSASQLIGPSSGLGPQLESTLQEVSRAARSLGVLADYLERHPESLIRGKQEEKK